MLEFTETLRELEIQLGDLKTAELDPSRLQS